MDLENLTGELRVAHGVGEYWRMAGAVKSRLVNLLGLSDKDIPLELREQFGYAKKHSIELEATRDTTKDYLSTVVPLSGAISRMAHEFSSRDPVLSRFRSIPSQISSSTFPIVKRRRAVRCITRTSFSWVAKTTYAGSR